MAPALDLMAGHDAVILEEPPDAGFQDMLSGRMPVDDYLITLDLEYPAFGRGMARGLQRLHRAGKALFQVEPFMAELIHHPLFRELKRRLPADLRLTSVFLMKPAVREMGYRHHLYGPGDLLTLLYRSHDRIDRRREDLYAARALVYSKLIAKDEIAAGDDPWPHTRDELRTGVIVARLSLEDCRRLFPLIHRASTGVARKRVAQYLQNRVREDALLSGPFETKL